MQIQKIFKAGNSNVVSIPKSLLDELNLESGNNVKVEKKGNRILISPLKKVVDNHGINPKFMEMVDEFMENHKDVLKKLAKK